MLLVMLLIGGFVLLCSSLLLLAFLCHRKRWVPSCAPLCPGAPGTLSPKPSSSVQLFTGYLGAQPHLQRV